MPFKRSLLITGLLVAATTVAFALPAATSAKTTSNMPTKQLVVGGIHVGDIHDAGYNQAQHAGLIYLKDHFAYVYKGKKWTIKLLGASNIAEGPTVVTAMRTMIQQGAKLLFPMDFGYFTDAKNMAASNPGVKFEFPAGYPPQPKNMGDYWAASTPMNYALGAAAAKVSKTGKIGFIGSIPIPTIIASADAFHLGAQTVNKKIKTYVIFTGSWSDPGAEATAVRTLHSEGVDVVSGLVDSPITYIKTAAQDHMWSIGYHSKWGRNYAPTHWLSGVNFEWGPMFVTMAKQVINGTWKSKDWIAPVKAKVAGLAPFGKNVPMKAKQAATNIVNKFISGKQTSAFKGPVYAQNGALKVRAGVQPNGAFEQGITWLAKGMIGSTS
jgi:basic membrane protein A and related proteins